MKGAWLHNLIDMWVDNEGGMPPQLCVYNEGGMTSQPD